MEVREATIEDAASIHRILQELVAARLRNRPATLDFARDNYITHPDRLWCGVAVDEDGTILGFQALKLAVEGNEFDVQPGWGVIGTHVSPKAARRGVGAALFAVNREVARRRGLSKIDASIGADNVSGRAYYEAMGFETYRTPKGLDCKCYEVT
ncbi:MAG: N-acetyltransferase family protein [Paracoccaceae bacterium]